MSGLFVLSRTWAYIDQRGECQTQAQDGEYISALSQRFSHARVALVVVDEQQFDFVKGYNGQLPKHVSILRLRQTLRNGTLEKLTSQIANIVNVTAAVSSSSHVVVFMSSLSAVWTAVVARALRRKLFVYSGNDWAVDMALKLQSRPRLLQNLASNCADVLETLALAGADVRLVNSPKLFAKCGKMKGHSERVRPISQFDVGDLFARNDTCQRQTIRLVYPAAIVPRKNHQTLFHALSHLRTHGLDVELWLAGALESEQVRVDLLALAEKLNILSKVHFTGYLSSKSEMLSLLRNSDIFVLPSLNEGFPRALWEAMLQSLPCAVSRLPNIRAEIAHRNVALMFDPLDEADIASSVLRIASDGGLRRALINSGREYATEVFAETWGEQLERIFQGWH